jgi:predicted RNA-binding protein (virulence factor B family)
MVEIGKYNTLKVVKSVDFGMYLDGGEAYGEILMPTKYIPDGLKVGDEVNALVYLDNEGRPVATTESSFAQLGDITILKVRSLTRDGAFLDWGTSKDIFLPFKEQVGKITAGMPYAVFIYKDALTGRLLASMKLDKFTSNEDFSLSKGDQVSIIPFKKTDLGIKCIILPHAIGILYANEIFRSVQLNTIINAYIKNVREDGKIDLSLSSYGIKRIYDSADIILHKIQQSDGCLYLTDDSSPEEISKILQMSKKSFKQGLGKLYKLKKISIYPDCIKLL